MLTTPGGEARFLDQAPKAQRRHRRLLAAFSTTVQARGERWRDLSTPPSGAGKFHGMIWPTDATGSFTCRTGIRPEETGGMRRAGDLGRPAPL